MRRTTSTIILLVMFFYSPCFAEKNEFKPWGSKIRAGDEAYAEKKRAGKKAVSVTSGFQGGAYILIRSFQEFISSQDGPNCRHTPTCSAYGRGAVARFGALLGAFMAGERLLRCNPYHPPEIDPVPEKVFGK